MYAWLKHTRLMGRTKLARLTLKKYPTFPQSLVIEQLALFKSSLLLKSYLQRTQTLQVN